MPTYEYLCKACDHEFEREQRITDPKVRTCPKCKKRRVERLISQTSFVLKGGGWYNDLYSSSKGDKADTADTADKEKGPDKKADTAADSGGTDKKDKKKKPDSKKGSKSGGSSSSKSGSKGPKAAA